MKKISVMILDNNKSALLSTETKKFRSEITKQKNNPVCPTMTTIAVAKSGADSMKKRQFCIVRGPLDV